MEWCKQENMHTPIIAIGGILTGDVESIMNTGVYGIAVAGAITHSKNKKETVKEFLNSINHESTYHSR